LNTTDVKVLGNSFNWEMWEKKYTKYSYNTRRPESTLTRQTLWSAT